jgi:hypothetical protein
LARGNSLFLLALRSTNLSTPFVILKTVGIYSQLPKGHNGGTCEIIKLLELWRSGGTLGDGGSEEWIR